jgi:flagellar motor protein MotB
MTETRRGTDAWAKVSSTDGALKAAIERSRLIAKGYGEARPITDNGTDDGSVLNNRVAFGILDQQR